MFSDPAQHDIAGKAHALYEELRRAVVAEYDDSGQIGRRYVARTRSGRPMRWTIDEQTLDDDTVTIRDRDSLAQERIPISGARAFLLDKARRGLDDPKNGLEAPALERALARLGEAELPVQVVGVAVCRNHFVPASGPSSTLKRTVLDAEPLATVPRGRRHRRGTTVRIHPRGCA